MWHGRKWHRACLNAPLGLSAQDVHGRYLLVPGVRLSLMLPRAQSWQGVASCAYSVPSLFRGCPSQRMLRKMLRSAVLQRAPQLLACILLQSLAPQAQCSVPRLSPAICTSSQAHGAAGQRRPAGYGPEPTPERLEGRLYSLFQSVVGWKHQLSPVCIGSCHLGQGWPRIERLGGQHHTISLDTPSHSAGKV